MKRYTDTEKWESNYFASLEPDLKLIYLYILDRCDLSGVWKGNWAMAKMLTGSTRTVDEIKNGLECVPISDFSGKEKFVELEDGKIWSVKFLKFQNPSGIGSNKPMVIGIRKKIDEYKSLQTLIREVYGDSFFASVEPSKQKKEEKSDEPTDADTVSSKVEKSPTGSKLARKIVEETFGAGVESDAIMDSYKEYEEVRRKIKSPLSSSGQITRLLNKLSGLPSSEWVRCLQSATDNGWKSVYPENTAVSRKQSGVIEFDENLGVGQIGTGL